MYHHLMRNEKFSDCSCSVTSKVMAFCDKVANGIVMNWVEIFTQTEAWDNYRISKVQSRSQL